jgi:type IV pilus assembly protein PilB
VTSGAQIAPDGRAEPGPDELAALFGLPVVDLRHEPIDRDAAERLPLHVLERTKALPFRYVDGRLSVAIADPRQVQLVDELKLVSDYPLEVVVASQIDIEFELRRLLRAHEVVSRAAAMEDDLPGLVEETDLEAADGLSETPPIRLVNSIIVQAVEDEASDIHFLPRGDSLAARIRVDGILNEVERIPRAHAAGVISRIKVLAKLDIAEHRLPQDGRFTIRARGTGKLYDVRVAILPTVEGEGAIIRLLDKTRSAPTLTEIGLSNEMQMAIEQVLYRPTGAFLATGPTGSGKSTTIYAALSDMRRPEINVVTVEDPVEYRLDDVFQIQVNARAGLTFAAGLRSILRSDPDVVMVGEVRDLETAKITLEAALTGHVVLSTLHANDAPGAIARLNDLGVEPFMTGSAVTAVLAQRLVRRLCLECREPYRPDRAALESFGFPSAVIDQGPTLYRRRGCSRCTKGFHGRTGIYQLMVMDDRISRLAFERANRVDILAAAAEAGMRSLWDDGLAKVAAGITTVDEIARVAR